MKNKKKTIIEEHPYVLCTLDGFDRVPNTTVLLKAEDYNLLMKYINDALDKNSDIEFSVDPDDCGECCMLLEEYMRYNISAKPIRAETYEDICQVYEKSNFGFNYVLDALLSALYAELGKDLQQEEVKWLADRSETVKWTVDEEKQREEEGEKIDKQAAYLAANGLRNCSAEVCEAVSNRTVDMQSLKQQVSKIIEYAADLEHLVLE